MKALKPIADAVVLLLCALAGLVILADELLCALALALFLGKKVNLPNLVD